MKRIALVLFVFFLCAAGTNEVAKKSCPNTFTGKRREIAKTNIATGKPTETTIPQLYNRPLPSDDVMKNTHHVTHTSARSTPEKENVTIICWLYTYSYQDDGDYHLILGSSADKEDSRFFSGEVSGLPKKRSKNYKYYDKLKVARDQFKLVIKDSPPCPSSYISSLYDKPIKVEVTGSLFWDTEHTGGKCCSGPEGYKSESAWEVHPITEIHTVE